MSDGSNASNYSYLMMKGKSPIRKKELSPRLQEWDKIDEFDLFQFENIDEYAQNEQNKYQGLAGFAKIIEQSEKRPSFKHSIEKKGKSTEIISRKILRAEQFNEIYPPKHLYRSHSREIPYKKPKKLSRHSSETVLPIYETLSFLDNLLKKHVMTKTQEKKFKALYWRISSQNLLENKRQIKKFGPWGEIWEGKEQFIRQNSPYGHFLSYKLRPVIVKGGDDLRQEVLAMQIIRKLKEMLKIENITAYLRPYEVIVTSANSGIIGNFNILKPNIFIKFYI